MYKLLSSCNKSQVIDIIILFEADIADEISSYTTNDPLFTLDSFRDLINCTITPEIHDMAYFITSSITL